MSPLDSKYYPVAFLVLIGTAGFIMYSGVFVPKINLDQYKEVCLKYQAAATGTYSDKELLSLVTKVNYLFPDKVEDLNDPLEKEIKTCANVLSKRLSHK
ncbi:MAG: hypothetical protein OEW97_02360 [Gammaproteobacteria bacterium]|nr:hypothetical protein [Gammaproteobacteria bacterium]